MFQQLLLICCVFGLGSAWTQPSTCYVRQSGCSTDSEVLKDIRDYMALTSASLASISTSLEQLVEARADNTTTPEPTTTGLPPPPIGSMENPAASCKDIPQDQPSGYYYIGNVTSPIEVYCDMNRTSCSCNSTGGWTRVANLDMTDPNQTCPSGFQEVTRETPPLRTCGRPQAGCVSTNYSTYGVEYSHVCGRIIGYQDGTPDAFAGLETIEGRYVDGVSLTHGQLPREHIWTFAAAIDETRSDRYVCPCTQPDANFTGAVPSFIGQDYFCATGSRDAAELGIFYPDDPLWDGEGCGGNSTCCEFNNPPWFCKQLPQPTTDDIELRLCADGPPTDLDEDIPLEIVEIYVH